MPRLIISTIKKKLKSAADEYKTNEYAELLASFRNTEAFLDGCAFRDYKNYGVKQIEQRPSIINPDFDFAAYTERLRAETAEKYAKAYPRRRLDMRYANEVVRVYSYTYKNTERYAAYICRITATGYTDFYNTAGELFSFNGFGSNAILKELQQKLFNSSAPGGGASEAAERIDWYVGCRFILDARKEDFEELYNSVFKDFCINLKWQSELKDLMAEKQREIDDDYREARRINAETAEMVRKGNLERASITYRAQKDISEIQKSVYENTSKAQERANRRFSETFNNRYTYTDSYGDEYKASGYGHYTYKRNDTIINTDDPEPPGWDWKELKKK